MKFRNCVGMLSVLALMTWGCSENTPRDTQKKSTKEAPATAPASTVDKTTTAPAATTPPAAADDTDGPDEYGRMPGDEHYGHSHAPNADEAGASAAPQFGPINTPATTPATGPDAYGRMPGDEHYGHNHD